MRIRFGQVWKSKRNGQVIVIGPRAGDGMRWHFKAREKAHTINENRLRKWYELVKA